MEAQTERCPQARLGTIVGGAYRIDELLGTGGAAAVYSATHRDGARVALKIMHYHLQRNADMRERFLQEAELARLIDHPARVAVHAVTATDEGVPMLVIELLDGNTLESLLARGLLSEADALRIAEQILSFLAACHARSIVHRDIKPSNVFITADGQVKLLDLGVALVSQRRITTRRRAIGTPTYMSPEQARAQRDIDPRADIFAVGALLFHLLSGVEPRIGRTEREALSIAAGEPLRPVRLVAPELSDRLAALIDRATSFDREARYPNAQAMRAAVLACLAVVPRETMPLRDLALSALELEEDVPPRVTMPEVPASLRTMRSRWVEASGA